jgi:hypothetical protein
MTTKALLLPCHGAWIPGYLLFALYHTTATSSHTFHLFRTGNTRPHGNSPLSGSALRDVETRCQCPVIGGGTHWRGEIEDLCEFLIGLDSSSLRSNTLIKMRVQQSPNQWLVLFFKDKGCRKDVERIRLRLKLEREERK